MERGSQAIGNARTTDEILKTYLFLTVLSGMLVLIHISTSIVLRRSGFHIPGISGITWIPLLVIGKVKWRAKISGIYMASISTAAVLMITPMFGIKMIGGVWILPFLRYGIPGALLDLFWPFVERFSNKPPVYVVAATAIAALSHTGKAFFVLITRYFPGQHIHYGLSVLVLSHLAFGIIGGVIGVMIGYFSLKGKNRNMQPRRK